MNIKKFNVLMLFAVVFQFLAPLGTITTFSASETKDTSCFTTSLSVNADSVLEGYQLQFDFEYKSVEPACSAEEVTGQQINLDFSQFVDSDADLSYSADTDVFDVSVDSGIVTLTFKDLSSENETLTDFGGNVVITANAKQVDESEDVTISDDSGNSITVTVDDDTKDTVNTNKLSTPDFVKAGDTIEYTVMINGFENEVENFKGVDSHSASMEYVPGSFSAEEDGTWIDMTDYFTTSLDDAGNLIIENTKPFDSKILLHYQMTATADEEIYHNDFEANYDSTIETASDDVWYDAEGSSWMDYTHGNIEITKVSEDETPLAGAEFDVINSKGNVVDHVVTGDDGIATTIDLPLGKYTVVETVAPDGYVLDNTPHEVTITAKDSDMIFELTVVDQKEEEVVPSGKIKITKVNENHKTLANAEFNIVDSTGTVVDHVITNDKGIATSIDLPLGTYSVIETKAPDGYKLDKTPHKVTIKTDGEIVEITVVNKCKDDGHGGNGGGGCHDNNHNGCHDGNHDNNHNC